MFEMRLVDQLADPAIKETKMQDRVVTVHVDKSARLLRGSGLVKMNRITKKYKMDWRDIWTLATGLDPPVHYFPAAVSAIALFIAIFTFCFIMHRLSQIFVPDPIQIYALDFFKTLAFCAYPFGIIILRKYHGDIGFALCAVPLNTVTALMLGTGEGSPIGNWLSLVKGTQTVTSSLSRICVQMMAGIAGYRLGKFLMNFDLHPDFEENLRQTGCMTALNVSVTLGILIEILGTGWDTWFHFQHLSNNIVLDKILKFCNTSLTFCLGVSKTGMFMHPAKAFGLTFGCRGITPLQHILVYCGGPMIGSFIAYQVNFRYTSIKKSDKKTERNPDETSKNNKTGVRQRKSRKTDG